MPDSTDASYDPSKKSESGDQQLSPEKQVNEKLIEQLTNKGVAGATAKLLVANASDEKQAKDLTDCIAQEVDPKALINCILVSQLTERGVAKPAATKLVHDDAVNDDEVARYIAEWDAHPGSKERPNAGR